MTEATKMDERWNERQETVDALPSPPAMQRHAWKPVCGTEVYTWITQSGAEAHVLQFRHQGIKA